jgi:E3 ubiquitin-protein ligase BRE1
MRDKETIDTERKNASRNVEKQAKAIEKLSDSEKNLLAQVVSWDAWQHCSFDNVLNGQSELERELVLVREAAESHKQDADVYEHESKEWKHRAELEQARNEEVHLYIDSTSNCSHRLVVSHHVAGAREIAGAEK